VEELTRYYLEDVRTTFVSPLEGLTCNDHYGTCVRFNESAVCFGNTDDRALTLDVAPSALFGLLLALLMPRHALALGACLVFVGMRLMSLSGTAVGAAVGWTLQAAVASRCWRAPPRQHFDLL